jgi:hypothetical protein
MPEIIQVAYGHLPNLIGSAIGAAASWLLLHFWLAPRIGFVTKLREDETDPNDFHIRFRNKCCFGLFHRHLYGVEIRARLYWKRQATKRKVTASVPLTVGRGEGSHQIPILTTSPRGRRRFKALHIGEPHIEHDKELTRVQLQHCGISQNLALKNLLLLPEARLVVFVSGKDSWTGQEKVMPAVFALDEHTQRIVWIGSDPEEKRNPPLDHEPAI